MIRLKPLLERKKAKRIHCAECPHSWPVTTGGTDPYVCHECGHDNTPTKESLAEITLGGIAPYATQFVWRSTHSAYEARVQCDGVPVQFEMASAFTPDGEEFEFAIAMPGDPGKWVGSDYTVTHGQSAVTGQLSYLRVLQTAGEAILDFCAQYAPPVINVTGFDTESGKDLQKTRIYRGLLHANSGKLAAAGYRILDRNGKLYIVTGNRYDATGIED
jgi:hypothetical protein